MESLATALFVAALALLGKVSFDAWNRHHERRTIAAALAGEIAAYISPFEREPAAESFRKIAELPTAIRQQRMAGFPVPPSGHPVFDKVAGRIGLLSASHARDVSRFYNAVTAFRIFITNLSSEKFLKADDDYQKAMLQRIAATIETQLPLAQALVKSLEEVSRDRSWNSLLDMR
jgi:hypothetical protein